MVTAVNDAPIAIDDAATTAEDTPVSIAVLGNDTDVDGDRLSVTAVGLPAHGTVAIHPDGTITYTPAANYNGADGFTYTIGDGHGGAATGTVSVTITAVNDAPVAVDDTATTAEDTPANIAVLANDTDVDGDRLSVTAVSVPAHGSTAINSDGTITYAPAANYDGPDTFTYTIGDGHGGTAGATVAITVTGVNDAPVATNDTAITAEDTPVTIAVLGNDTDVDGDTLLVTAASTPPHGSAAINPDGTITYTPVADYNGADGFTYTISDGHGGTASAPVTVTVTAVNDAPVAANDSYSTPEDTTLTVGAPGVLGNDTDTEGSSLTALLAVGPSHGTLNLKEGGGFTYIPVGNFNGTDSFSYHANDGVLSSQLATVTITVTPVNHAPSASDDSVTAHLDAPVAVKLTAWDADNDKLSYRVSANAAHGALTGTPPSLIYTPNAGFLGMDGFTFIANDGTADSSVATVTIRVLSEMNRPPEAEDQWIFIDEDTPSDAQLLAGDPENDRLTFTIVTPPSHGTLHGVPPNLVYTPERDFNGWDFFTFVASDGVFDSNEASVNFWIWEVNDAPVAQNLAVVANGDTPVGGQLAVTDPEGDWLYYALASEPENGTVTIDPDSGAFTYTPGPNSTGYDRFTYAAYDWQTQSNDATVEIISSPGVQ